MREIHLNEPQGGPISTLGGEPVQVKVYEIFSEQITVSYGHDGINASINLSPRMANVLIQKLGKALSELGKVVEEVAPTCSGFRCCCSGIRHYDDLEFLGLEDEMAQGYGPDLGH